MPDIQHLSKYVTCILGQNPSAFTLQGTNTYLVGDPNSKERLLIDAGSGHKEYYYILRKYLKDNDLKITTIAITHSHIDHIGGASDILELSPEAVLRKYLVPEKDAHMKKAHYFVEFSDLDAVHWADEQVIEVGNVHIKAYYTPGHCCDHLSFWLEEEQTLFSGDNLLGHGSSVFEDYNLYISSLLRMRDLPFLRRVYPGHGKTLENGVAAFNSLIEHRYERVAELYAVLKSANAPLTEEELVSRVYTDFYEKPELVRMGAIGNAKQYLAQLQRQGRVHFDEDRWRA